MITWNIQVIEHNGSKFNSRNTWWTNFLWDSILIPESGHNIDYVQKEVNYLSPFFYIKVKRFRRKLQILLKYLS